MSEVFGKFCNAKKKQSVFRNFRIKSGHENGVCGKKKKIILCILSLFFSVQFLFAQPGFYEIEAGAFYYSPNTLEIEAGSTVTWVNLGGLHDVNF